MKYNYYAGTFYYRVVIFRKNSKRLWFKTCDSNLTCDSNWLWFKTTVQLLRLRLCDDKTSDDVTTTTTTTKSDCDIKRCNNKRMWKWSCRQILDPHSYVSGLGISNAASTLFSMSIILKDLWLILIWITYAIATIFFISATENVMYLNLSIPAPCFLPLLLSQNYTMPGYYLTSYYAARESGIKDGIS